MSRIKKLCALILILLQLMQFGIYSNALDYEPQLPPYMLRVEPVNGDEPPIGYNEYDKNYVDLKWKVDFPAGYKAGYLNIYTQEVPKSYRPPRGRAIRERNIPGSLDNYRLKGLESGTIYNIDMTAYYTRAIENGTYTSPESAPSNRLKVLTDISISAYSTGANKIKIEWDDVWNNGGRIDYKLYVSENSNFTNTPPIYIGQNQIGKDKPVKVNETTGKLEYVHTVRDPGRVYYVRIEPDVVDNELKKSQYSKTVTVSSFILVKTSKISTTDSGVIWKLEWSPVVTGLNDRDVKISYHIYRGIVGAGDLPQYMAAVDGTNFFVTLPLEGEEYYFIIRAMVTKDGKDLYENIRIESDRIIVGEQELPSRPASPELVDKFERVSGDPIISYKEELKPNSATILWRAPLKGDGKVDYDVSYDMWLINDPDLIDSPPDNLRIADSIKMSNENAVMNGNILVGFKYVITNLTPNTTYYFKIVAKKQFLENVNNELQNVDYMSDPAYKIIITPADEPIDQPLVPGKPPLRVKKTSDDKDMITQNSVTIQLKNLWYEKYNFEENKWEYIRTEKLSENDIPPIDLSETVIDDVYYRMVSYDSSMTIDVGCTLYVEGMSFEELNSMPANKLTGFPAVPNDPKEDASLNPDGKRHNIDITIGDLMPNTMYVIWVKASRPSMNLTSGPSDPIIITTRPVIDTPLDKPIVPSFNYSVPGDNFIDLGWEISPGYNYYLKYGVEDKIDAAKANITVTSEELKNSIYYRVGGLLPDTLYYFWVQAEAVNELGESSRSEWSDSYPVRTLKLLPPDAPKGFGIKNTKDAISKNSITFEWIKENGLQYILEISKDIDYKDSQEYNAGENSEFTVEKLLSNHRYYARLYSYDPVKQMRSEPTQSISVRTRRSDDDYDSDQDIEEIITGDFIEKGSTIIDGIWQVRITGINADRFIEHVYTDNKLDYKIDLKEPPGDARAARLLISDKVFKALTVLKENLIIDMGSVSIVIRPGVIATQDYNPYAQKSSGVDYDITITYPKDNKPKFNNMTFKTSVVKLEVLMAENGDIRPMGAFLRPLKVLVPYKGANWYREGKTFGVYYNSSEELWEKLLTSAVFDKDRDLGTLSFETLKTGQMAVAEIGNDFFDDIYSHKYETAIRKVASVHELKSVKGRSYDPDKTATVGDAVKLMLDVLDYDYGADYISESAKAGLISFQDTSSAGQNCTIEKVSLMLARVFEIKTGQILEQKSKSEFAAQNGMVIIRDNGKLASPKDYATRAEVVALLEKLLVYIGELD